MLPDPVIRHATAADIRSFYGSPRRETLRAFVADLDGDVIAVWGLARKGESLTMFSDLKPEAYRYRKTIVREGRKALEIANGLTVLAVAQPEIVGSDRYLKALGFKHAYTSVAGEVYAWRGHA